MSTGVAFICPHCGQLDKVRKVSSIVSEGISTGHYQSLVPFEWQGKTYFLPANREVSSFSLLAKRLLPPQAPSKPLTLGALIVAYFIFVLVNGLFDIPAFLIYLELGAITEWSVIASLVLLALLIVSVSVAVRIAARWYKKTTEPLQQSYMASMSAWNRALGRWAEEVYYCSRDDNVFILGQDRSVPPEEIKSLIYS